MSLSSFRVERSRAGGHVVHLYCPIYRVNVFYYPRTTPESYDKVLKYWDAPDELLGWGKTTGARCVSFNHRDGGRTNLVFTLAESKLSELVHECVHAAIDILDSRGWKIDPQNDEPLTYLVQWLFDSMTRGVEMIDSKESGRRRTRAVRPSSGKKKAKPAPPAEEG